MMEGSNEFDRLVSERRSIRRYAPTPPADNMIEAMVAAALQAPSPSNRQPVHFVRIASEQVRSQLATALQEGYDRLLALAKAKSKRLTNWVKFYHRYAAFMNTGPVLMAVGTQVDSEGGFGRHLQQAGVLQTDPQEESDLAVTAGLSLGLFLLKGKDLGLGTCVLTAPLIFISNISGLLETEDLTIRCLVTVGFPDETPLPMDRLPMDRRYRTV